MIYNYNRRLFGLYETMLLMLLPQAKTFIAVLESRTILLS